MVIRLTRALGPLGSGLVALVLSHSLVYLVRYGSAYGEALAHSGHDATWTIAAWSSAILGGGLAVAGIIRLLLLAQAIRGTRANPAARPDRERGAGARATAPWPRGWLLAGARLAAVTAIALTVQENAEHLAAGLPLQGPLMLVRPEYPFALAIVVATSLAVSLVVQAYRRRRDALLARLRATPPAFTPARRAPRPDPRAAQRPASILGRVGGLRAPPSLLAR